jgi:hypothetical protein
MLASLGTVIFADWDNSVASPFECLGMRLEEFFWLLLLLSEENELLQTSDHDKGEPRLDSGKPLAIVWFLMKE